MTTDQRLASLEQQVRLFKRTTIVLLAVSAVVVFSGAKRWSRWCSETSTTPGTVYAQRFVLVDSAGNERGDLHLVENEPLLELYGSGGERGSLVQLGVSPNNQRPAILGLHSNGRTTRVNLEAAEQYVHARVWGNGTPLRYAELKAGPDTAPGLSINWGTNVNLHARAFGSRSEVLVRAGNQEKKLVVP